MQLKIAESRADEPPTAAALDGLERAPGLLRIGSALLVLGALWWGQMLIVPVVLSIFISYALEPAVLALEARRVPRMVGVPLLLILVTSAVAGTIYALRAEAVAFGNRLPQVSHRLAEAVRHHESDTPGPVAKLQQAANELESAASTNRQPPPTDGVTPVRIEEPAFKWNDWVWQGSHGALELATQLFAVVFLVYYLLMAGDLYRRKIVRIVGPALSDKKMTLEILNEIHRQIARFLWARATISGAVALAVWLAFHAVGLDDPGVWAVLSGLVFAVPIVGPLVIVVASALAAFVQFGSVQVAGLVAAATLAIAAVEGNVLTPLLMRRVGEMNAVAVFVSLMFWGWMWGLWGLLLAVPITAALKAVCERVDDLAGFAELLKT